MALLKLWFKDLFSRKEPLLLLKLIKNKKHHKIKKFIKKNKLEKAEVNLNKNI